jgi:glycosyltransferase involved in cell wall biosynthesis
MNFLVPYLVRWNSLNRSRYYQIFNYLAQHGHQVHILQPPLLKSSDTGFSETEQSCHPNIHLHEIAINSPFWKYDLPFNKIIKKGHYCLKINKSIEKFISEFNIDAIFFYNMVLHPLSKIDNVVTIYDLGDDHIDLLNHELGAFSNPLILSYASNLLRKTLTNCDLVFSVSHYLTEKYYNNSIYLPNGATLEEVHPGSGHDFRDEYQGPVIGFVGSLEYFINFDHLLEAAAVLRDCTFVIAGGGREYDGIIEKKQKLGLDNLILTGGLPHQQILQRIDSFDICLNLFKKSPLTDGACPIKLFEYMAFKKPIISSRISEVMRIDDDFFYWADTADELISRVQEILADKAATDNRVAREHDLLKKTYTWPRISEAFLNDVKQAFEQKHARNC